MQNGVIVTLALILLLGFGGYTLAHQVHQNPYQGQQMMGQGQVGPQGQVGSGMMGSGRGMMGPGMWGHMGSGMGMMGGMMGSPEIMGTMMSIRGEMMILMGQMMQKYGGQMTPELWQKNKEGMLERMGEILTRHGTALKERAKAAGK